MRHGAKMPPLWGFVIFQRKIFKNLLRKCKAQSLDIWYIASPNGPVPRLSNIMRPGAKMPPLWGFVIFFKEKSLKICKAQSLDIWYVASTHGPVPRL